MIGKIKTIAGERTHIGPHSMHVHIRKPFYFAHRWFGWEDRTWVGIGVAADKVAVAESMGRKLQLSWYARRPTYTLTPARFRILAEKWGGHYRVKKTDLMVVPSGKLINYKDRVMPEPAEELSIPSSVMDKLRGSPGYKKVMEGRP